MSAIIEMKASKTEDSYNGYANYETWNVALWINNDEGLYRVFQDFRCDNPVDMLELCKDVFGPYTPDDVYIENPAIDWDEVVDAVYGD